MLIRRKLLVLLLIKYFCVEQPRKRQVAMDANTKSMSVTKRWVSSNTIKTAATYSDSLMSPPPPVFFVAFIVQCMAVSWGRHNILQ